MKRNTIVTLFSATCCSAVAAAQQDMNVILILADDLGYECIGANGSQSYSTPNIDRMAEQGIRFTNCYACPKSTPSRVSMLTGMYNVRNYVRFGLMKRDQTTFVNLLEDAGYKTAVAGKWQLGEEADSPQHFGFQEACLWQHRLPAHDQNNGDTRYGNPVLEYNGEAKSYDNGEYAPDIVAQHLLDFISENKDEKFFAFYPMLLTHYPFVTTPDSKNWDPSRPTNRGDNENFGDMVSYADKIVGRFVDHVEKLGLADNTMIIFVGDNGTSARITSRINGEDYVGGKGETTRAGTHVPMLILHPDAKKGEVNDNLIDFTDFFPTICDATNVSAPSSLTLDGVNFYPQILDKESPVREWVYCWYSANGKKIEGVCASDKCYKLYTTGEFYNIVKDPLELSPITALSDEQKASYAALSEVLDRYNKVERPVGTVNKAAANKNKANKKNAKKKNAKKGKGKKNKNSNK